MASLAGSQAERLYGWSAEEVVGKRLLPNVPEAKASEFDQKPFTMKDLAARIRLLFDQD